MPRSSKGGKKKKKGKKSANMTARERTLDIPELLERILLHLPIRDLLRSPAVSKQWQTMVATSPNIQRALFYQPVDGSTIEWNPRRNSGMGSWETSEDMDEHYIARPLLNPLLRKFLNYFRVVEFYDGLPTFGPDDDDGDSIENYVRAQWAISHHGIVAPAFSKTESKFSLRPMHHRQASWRSMSFTQPPCRRLVFECTPDSRNYLAREKFTIEADAGEWLTMDDIVTGLRNHWHYCPECPLEPLDEASCWKYGGQPHVSQCFSNGWNIVAKAEHAVANFNGARWKVQKKWLNAFFAATGEAPAQGNGNPAAVGAKK